VIQIIFIPKFKSYYKILTCHKVPYFKFEDDNTPKSFTDVQKIIRLHANNLTNMPTA
jgi:hypothetical protein